MPTEPRVLVDGRREGTHGIARFGREVVGRLATPHTLLRGPRNALSPIDLLNPDRLRLRRDDVVYSPGFHAGPTRARQLLTLHDLIQLRDRNERSIKKSAFYRYVVRPAVLRAGRVVTVSETARREIREWLDDAVPVIDVGNGCSDVFFATDRSERPEGLLYVGAMKPHKNAGVAYAALAALPGARMTVVTNDLTEAERLGTLHGVAARVTVRTKLSDPELGRLYGSAAALLIPSRAEGFGLPAAEALAVGCPVIHWSGCSAVSEIVEASGTAVDDPDDPRAWADAADAALSGALQVDARSRMRRRYSWASVAARVDDELRTLLAM